MYKNKDMKFQYIVTLKSISDYQRDLIKKLNELRHVMLDPLFGALGIRDDQEYGSLSARLNQDSFLHIAKNTIQLSSLRIEHYPEVNYDKHLNLLTSTNIREFSPGIEAVVHDGFYKGNSKIRCVAHGYFSPIHRYYRIKPDEAVVIEEETDNVEEMRELILKTARDERVLKHNAGAILYNNTGHYGLLIQKSDLDGFFIVGESIEAVLSGISISGNKSLSGIMGFFNRELSRINCDVY